MCRRACVDRTIEKGGKRERVVVFVTQGGSKQDAHARARVVSENANVKGGPSEKGLTVEG